MAKLILAAPAGSHNPLSYIHLNTACLTELFLLAYQRHISQSDPEVGNFITQLRQLVALGYKACRQYPHRRCAYNIYRQQFLQYDEGDFHKHLYLVDVFAQGLAQMTQWAVQSYQALGCPESYELFLQVLEDILKPEKIASIAQQTAAYQLLEELKQLY